MPRLPSGFAGLVLLAGVVAFAPSAAQSTTNGDALAALTCTISGTAENDDLRGTNGPDVICALAGNDIVRGLKGNDLLIGGMGDDQLFGGAGRDEIHGDYGFDFIQGDGADDALYGGPDGDTFNATQGSTAGVVADGTDVMVGGVGSDTASYLRRLTPLRVTLDGAANDGAVGENDQAGVPGPTGGPDVENVNGGRSDDVLTGTSGPNFLVSRGGADIINGLGGADTIDTLDRTPDDTVDAGQGQDYCASDLTDDLTSCEQIFPGS